MHDTERGAAAERGLSVRALAGVVLVAAALGCQPPDAQGTVRAYVYAWDAQAGTYAMAARDVENLSSLRELSGRDFSVRRGADLNLELNGKVGVGRGEPFRLEYSQTDDGVVVPGDLHSLYGLSLYRAFDRAASAMRAHGYTPHRPLDIFYFPRMDNIALGDGRFGLTDNAAFASQAHGFLLVPSFLLTDLPMLLNEGVVGHEFGHSVIHQQLFGDAPDEPGAGDPDWRDARRHLLSMHEGVADLLGFALVGDPNFIAPTVDVDRDLSEPKDYLDRDYEELTQGEPTFDPHRHGSFLARAVYELWPKENGQVTAQERSRLVGLTLEALRRVQYTPEFNFGSFAQALVELLPEAERARACAVLTQRLAPLAPVLTSCGATP